MKGRLQIETSPNHLTNSNLLTENLKIFSTTSSNLDNNLKTKIFNNLINSKQNATENSTKTKFDTFKMNILIKGRNVATSPLRISSTHRSLKNDDIQFLSSPKFLHEKNEIINDDNLFREKINNIKSDIYKLLSKNSKQNKKSAKLENLFQSKKTLTSERLERMKNSVHKTLERDFSLEKNLVKEKMKKFAENSTRESKAIKNLKNSLYKSASKKNLIDPMDDLNLPTYKRELVESKNISPNASSRNWNKNKKEEFFLGEEKNHKNFGVTFSAFKAKSFIQVFTK